jgi:capsular exopolysaccharide synthesis family protein
MPYKPNWRQNMLAGLMVSLLVAVACALLIERMDDTVRSGKDLERRLGAAPLGVIPVFERTLADEDGYLLTQRQASSNVADALRNLHIGLEVTYGAHRTGQPLVITVTSAVPHEGKTFLAANLATLFAGLGRKVLVVDADLRKGSLTRSFKSKGTIGLREVVASGKWSPEYALNNSTPGYGLLPVTEASYDSPESLNPDRFARVIPQMKSGYDVVIFDTPPVLAVADACVTGQSSDVVLLVLRSRQTRLAQVERAAAALYAANVKQVLFVVNGVDAADAASDAYGYGYGYDYGEGYGYGGGSGSGYGYGYGQGRHKHKSGKRQTAGSEESDDKE